MRVSERELKDLIDSFGEEIGIRLVPNFCYGAYGVNILIPNSAGAVTTLIGLGTKKETYNELQTIRNYLCSTDTRFDKYKISTCTHRDSLNHYEGKKDVGVCHEITKTNGRTKKETKSYWCSGCHRKDISKEEFLKSEIPITFKALRSELGNEYI